MSYREEHKIQGEHSMERIGDTNGRNIRSLCTLRYTCLNTKSWFLSKIRTKNVRPIHIFSNVPGLSIKRRCSMTACTLSLSLGDFHFASQVTSFSIVWVASCVVRGPLSINIVISPPAYNADVKYTQTLFTIRLSISLSNTSRQSSLNIQQISWLGGLENCKKNFHRNFSGPAFIFSVHCGGYNLTRCW